MAAPSLLLLYLSAFLAVSNSEAGPLVDSWDDDASGMEYYFPSPPPPERGRCEDVRCRFPACVGFLSGEAEWPPARCCSNLEELNAVARAEGPRRICACIEDLSASFVDSRIREIYKRCDIHLSFPISQHMDCSR
ncbi:unnamed protein product [Cuscuta campestris]|uniref:Bifunctional inhibitor/plant lipid transfer protein/seed storage helical domain-containing protein n=2 Tax=Cuscuta sect. Cleistogrammica TaxID=1824901 RepID=A0A484KF51_9ASTE|nr:hypothetical protein DM860_014719 [Cuscuta australis]VFQ61827.1 unnamed protein product [Cuscuta campestris]